MGAEGGRNSGQGLAQWEQSPCHSGSLGVVSLAQRMNGLPSREWEGAQFRQAVCAERIIFFRFHRPSRADGNFLSPSIVPSCGIFPHTRSHLTNFEAIPESGDVRARSLRLRLKDGSGRDDVCRQGEVWGA